ncbi:hypothetical protein ABFS82_09G134700 [Erythranthe guttata]|uniref:trihelix transcription factor ASIL2-like n=1 Tax=Erythranthe guttata TaxID=4155 RepID=UPI00064DE181|nr:PREDICTED: trihelix transcription factor ASIL2-like [Erythranthe guttata]|eukprot:XP_012856279.1 PREDICTED: trihelix transcription factor ASIL2-like [Erythranthe guttata]
MEEDDEIQSPTPNGRITVTVASAPPSNSLTLALPIQPQKTPGREDCWSEAATAVLIDAWGERYLELSRGNLKQKHWKDVADIVCSREDYAKTPKTDIQCKNRIDTVKKKYKTEKAKIASGGGPSKWRFFDKLDVLIGPTPSKSNSTPPPPMDLYQRGVPMGIPVGIRSSSSVLKRPSFDSEDESEPENSADSSDGLPPDTYNNNNKRGKIQKMEMPTVNNANGSSSQRRDGGGMRGNGRKNKEESNWANSMKELTRAVLKFGEAYEQAETAKLQQLVEMEKQRMKFAKELELQRMQYFMKTQMELSQIKNRSSANTNNHHHHHHRRVISNNNNNDANNNNTKKNNNTKNSDSSN